jgi:hypothetical protein
MAKPAKAIPNNAMLSGSGTAFSDQVRAAFSASFVGEYNVNSPLLLVTNTDWNVLTLVIIGNLKIVILSIWINIMKTVISD